jgi:hypothetical protein
MIGKINKSFEGNVIHHSPFGKADGDLGASV